MNDTEDSLITFEKLIDSVATLTESREDQAIFCDALSLFDEKALLGLLTQSIEEGRLRVFNIASLLGWHNQPIFLKIVLEKTPSLLWQRTTRDGRAITTPLAAAAHTRSLSLLTEVLEHPAMIAYASICAVEYASLIDDCLSQCKQWFIVHGGDAIEYAILENLRSAARTILFSTISMDVMTNASLKIYRQALPLEPLQGAPDYTKHVDLKVCISSGALFASGGDVDDLAKECTTMARRICIFLRNPQAYPTRKLACLIQRIPEFFVLSHQLIELDATHLDATIQSTKDAQTTVLTLRFIRLSSLVAFSCA